MTFHFFCWIKPVTFLPAASQFQNVSEAAAVMSRYDALLNRPEVHFQHRYEARRTSFSPAGHGYLQPTKMSLGIVTIWL
jgi:hypothetical protein